MPLYAALEQSLGVLGVPSAPDVAAVVASVPSYVAKVPALLQAAVAFLNDPINQVGLWGLWTGAASGIHMC